ncbi:SoxR reducing system RseC family protein [Aliikangiella maris]|uniref:SoxR reducing system RseC family protein n=2 Tax=Aliikangiella maris TaxID=3162458 RepID=A0ABV3MK17_9GAMM
MNTEQPMLYETGLVTKLEGDIAWVNTKAKLACSSCKIASSCGSGILENYLSGKIFVSPIENRLNASIGDEVIIAVAKSSVTKASLLVYFVPLLGLVCGAIGGTLGFNSEPVTIALAMLGLLIGIMVIRFNQSTLQQNSAFIPKMVKKKSSPLSTRPPNEISVLSLPTKN